MVPFKLISTIFCEKIYVYNKHKGNKAKAKPIKPILLKKLIMNQFWASWSSEFIYRGLTIENKNLKNGQKFVTVWQNLMVQPL